MAFVKISQLPAVENVLPLTGGDLMPIVHGATTYNVQLTTLQNYFNANQNLSAAGKDGYVQYSLHGALCADPGFLYIPATSSIQIGYDNLVTGYNSGILGGAYNTVSNNNTFALGSFIQSNLNDYTLVNNLSSMFLINAGNENSSIQWNQGWLYSNAQSARLSMPYLDARYVSTSGAFLTGNYTTTGSFSALSAVYSHVIQTDLLGVNTAGLPFLPPQIQATVVGNLSVTGSIYGSLTGSLPPIANTVYVSVSGNDLNSGLTMFSPFRTIKRAAAFVAANQSGPFVNYGDPGAPALSGNIQYTIWCYAGNYTEQNPIYLPPFTSLMSDNLKRANIYPLNPTYDILWQNTGNYTWGFTFRNYYSPAAANAFPILSAGQGVPWSARTAAMTAIAYQYGTTVGEPQLYDIASPNVKPVIFTSPYIQGCSSITGNPLSGLYGGCGVRVDGSLVGGFLRSFVMDSFTQTNQGGIGIHITNNGYAQLVSTFTICCSAGVQADNGGQCSINTSNCSFGTYGLLAVGYSSSPVLTAVTTSNAQYNALNVNISGAFCNFDPQTYIPYNTWSVPVSAPYAGMVYTISNDPNPGTLYALASSYVIDPSNGVFTLFNTNTFANVIPAGGTVSFYIRSQITTSSHTFEYVGSGTTLQLAVPALGGVGIIANEAVALSGASVFFTSTNNFGDFRVGAGFTILQSTGTIVGLTFDRSIISLVTPLTIALE